MLICCENALENSEEELYILTVIMLWIGAHRLVSQSISDRVQRRLQNSLDKNTTPFEGKLDHRKLCNSMCFNGQ